MKRIRCILIRDKKVVREMHYDEDQLPLAIGVPEWGRFEAAESGEGWQKYRLVEVK
jgi:hypothetical protein